MSPIFAATAAAQAQLPRADALIEAMKTGDEAALVRARQMLPYTGVDTVQKLVPLLSHPEERVWRTVFNVLSDFANLAGAPGHEQERAQVTAWLMTLVAPERTPHEKEQGLRLLPLVVPAGQDLGPITALLRDADAQMAEKARTALQDIGTPEAAAALRAALPQSAPAFQAALLDALTTLGDTASADAAAKLLESADPAVRVAAARLLAITGDLDYLTALKQAAAQADPASKEDAARAVITLVNHAAANGGQWEATMHVLLELLNELESPVLRGAVLVSLGRYGDARSVPLIIETTAKDADLALAGPAIRALDYQYGRAAREAIVQAYDTAPAGLRSLLLAMMGHKQDAGYVELLARETGHQDPAIRDAAREALTVLAKPEAVAPLVAAVNNTSGEEKLAAVAQLKRLADSMRAQNAPQAGSAYVALYHAAATDEDRAAALQGIKQFPVPEAWDIVAQAVGKEELAAFPPAALAGIAKALDQAGRKDEAKQTFDLLLARMDSPAALQEVLQLAPQLGLGQDLTQRLGFLLDWHIVGPFPWKMSEGFSVEGIDAATPALDAALSLAGKSAPWREVHSADALGIVNLASEFGMVDQSRAYAFTTIDSPQATDAELRLGSDDGIAAWLNGEKVFENNVDRPLAPDQDQAPIKLKQGKNALLLEITQGAGGWMFCARLTTPDGKPLQ